MTTPQSKGQSWEKFGIDYRVRFFFFSGHVAFLHSLCDLPMIYPFMKIPGLLWEQQIKATNKIMHLNKQQSQRSWVSFAGTSPGTHHTRIHLHAHRLAVTELLCDGWSHLILFSCTCQTGKWSIRDFGH